jgi:rSAM/selenodomain-associated transferase 1/rSAM/selenodomain-associated transferase 2
MDYTLVEPEKTSFGLSVENENYLKTCLRSTGFSLIPSPCRGANRAQFGDVLCLLNMVDLNLIFKHPHFRKIVSNPTDQPHLIVFGRYPQVGKTKTRLIPALGPAGAAALQKRMTEKTVAAARRVTERVGGRLVFCHDGGNQQQARRWLGGRHIDYMPQPTGDLGRRMHMAMKSAFDGGAHRVVLVGTDIPGLTPEILEQAFDALNEKDLVLGPSIDGGYWLVGMTRPENVFDGIAWSKPDVLPNTLVLARQIGLTPYLLEPLNDLDTPDDLAVEKWGRQARRPYLSVIIPAIDDALQITQTIVAATSPDAEIIVSDGGSTDRTVEIAKALGARIVSGMPGRAGQQNRAAAIARGGVLLFLHADTRLPNNYEDHIFETLMDRRTVIGAFRLATDPQSPAMQKFASLAKRRAGWLNLPSVDQVLFMRKGDFDAAGGFPEVPIAEDLYLIRLMGQNGRVALASAAAVTANRRWQRFRPMRTTIIQTIIALGCIAGVAPGRLAQLNRWAMKKIHR